MPPVQFARQSHCHALRESEALGALALVVPHKGMLKRHNLNKAPAYILSAAAACHLFNFHACACKPQSILQEQSCVCVFLLFVDLTIRHRWAMRLSLAIEVRGILIFFWPTGLDRNSVVFFIGSCSYQSSETACRLLKVTRISTDTVACHLFKFYFHALCLWALWRCKSPCIWGSLRAAAQIPQPQDLKVRI